MRRKYLGERACEDEIGGTKSQWFLFCKICDIIGSSSKVIGLSMQLIVVKNKKKKVYKKMTT